MPTRDEPEQVEQDGAEVEDQEDTERINRETRERAAEYDRTGEYIAGEDVIAWVKSWGTEKELPPPTRIRRRRG